MLELQWHSLADFLAMDGKGLYIWGAYGVAMLCMLTEAWSAARRQRDAWRSARQAHGLEGANEEGR